LDDYYQIHSLKLGPELGPSRSKWNQIPSPKRRQSRIIGFNGKVIATGGWDWVNDVEVFDDTSGFWLPLPSMKEGRALHGVCTTRNNQIVVVGGYGALKSVEILSL